MKTQTELRKITDIISKPSEALRAMVKGLLKADKRKTFRIDMDTFGEFRGGICYGCAATCALQEVGGVVFSNDRIESDEARALLAGIDEQSACDFEIAIDCARQGALRDLFLLFKLKIPESLPGYSAYDDGCADDIYLSDKTWKEEIPKVRKLIKALERNGY